MIKIENKILIYFTFYIKNISFLINEQIQDINNKERIPGIKFEDNSSFFNKIFNKKNKNILLIFSGIVLLLFLILLFISFLILFLSESKSKSSKSIFFLKLEQLNNKINPIAYYCKKKNENKVNEKKNLSKDFILKNLNLFDIYFKINYYKDLYSKKIYIHVYNNKILLDYFNKLSIKNINIECRDYIDEDFLKNIDDLNMDNINNYENYLKLDLNNFKNTINFLKNQNQKKKMFIIINYSKNSLIHEHLKGEIKEEDIVNLPLTQDEMDKILESKEYSEEIKNYNNNTKFIFDINHSKEMQNLILEMLIKDKKKI